MNAPNKTAFYTLVAMSVLTGLGIIWFDYALLLESIQKTSNQVVNTRNQLDILKMQEADFLEVQYELQDAQQIKNNLEFVSFSDGRAFIDTMRDISERSNVVIHFDVQNDASPVFKTQVNGSFANIILFLRRMSVTPTAAEFHQILQGPDGLTADITFTPTLSENYGTTPN